MKNLNSKENATPFSKTQKCPFSDNQRSLGKRQSFSCFRRNVFITYLAKCR